MKKYLLVFTALLMTCSIAFAHVTNENTIFDDTKNSNAKDDLVYLRTLNVIPPVETGANVYMPQDLLTKKDLGYWAAQFSNNDGKTDENGYVSLALKNHLIDSQDGNASYQDVITAFFGKNALQDADIQKLIKGKENNALTKEDAALLLGQLINRPNHDGLFDKAGFKEGPTGTITKVFTGKETEDGDTFTTYTFVVDGKKIVLDHHVKALHGPTTLENWAGKKLNETWISKGEDGVGVVLVSVDKGIFPNETVQPLKQPTQPTEKQNFPWTLTIGIVIVIVLLIVVAKTRKR